MKMAMHITLLHSLSQLVPVQQCRFSTWRWN